MFYPYRLAIAALAIVVHVTASQATDSYSDADSGRAGYLPNQNIDPAVIASKSAGFLFAKEFNDDEEFYAEPLVYAPDGKDQLLFLASSQNRIRTLDAETGDTINERQVQTPFQSSDLNCTEYGKTEGIAGTPIIDPATNVAYFFAKSYLSNFRTVGDRGAYNGVYYLYGVDIYTLEDVPGFPILMDGYTSDNTTDKYFLGGIFRQSTSLVQVDDIIYGGFGGRCGSFPALNNTALVIGVNVTSKELVADYPVQSGPLAARNQEDITEKQGDVFTTGMEISTDGKRLYLLSRQGKPGTPVSSTALIQDETFVNDP